MRLATRAQLITVGALIVVTLILVGIIGANHRDLLRQHLEESLAAEVTAKVSAIRTRIDASQHLLRRLAGGPAMHRFLDEGAAEDLTDRFAVLAANHPQILQVRFIDLGGQERLRVDRVAGQARVIPEANLQDKSGRAYVEQALTLAPGEVGLSALEPNREFGKIQYPLTPTLRLMMSVFDSRGQRVGLLVLNLDGSKILPAAHVGETELRIMRPDGTYLLHPDPAQTFGLERGTGADARAEFDLVPATLSAAPGFLRLEPSGPRRAAPALAAYQWVSLGEATRQRWLVMASVPENLLATLVRRDFLTLAGTAGLIAALACALIWAVLNRVARRLDHITQAARSISAGDRGVTVATQGDDELAILGQAFNGMTRDLETALAMEQKARAELEDTNTELQRSNADLESFARAAAHDLKTPLRALRILPTFIEEDAPDLGPELCDHLHEITNQAERLEDLVDGLLKYSLLGRERSLPESFAPGEVIDRVLRTCTLPEGFTLRQEIDLAVIHCVMVEFEIALRNMLQNAIRHHDRRTGTLVIRVTRDDRLFRIEVQDDGPGIPDAMKPKVLLPLRTGKSQEKGGGTGLGLAFIAKIADRRGGEVELLDAPGRGLIVRLSLPATPSEDRPTERRDGLPAAPPPALSDKAAPRRPAAGRLH
ncbi:sensor histidine kinase [Ferrimonas balearica]|nr:sensor histidine kinase [Ferrimonas balearica]